MILHPVKNILLIPDVECYGEVNDGDDDVGDGGEDVEDEVGHQIVDGSSATIHDPENFSSLPRHVPSQRQIVEMLEQTDLSLSGDELLDPDPEQRPGIVQQSLTHTSSL